MRVDGHQLSVESIFTAAAGPEAPGGWLTLTAAVFSAMTPDENLTNFFNGGEPSWEAVINSRLSRLQVAESLLDRTRRRIRENRAGIELLVGPTGEGKSTALRQAVAVLARQDMRVVLWRQQRDASLDEKAIEIARTHGAGTVLASDNAQLIVEQLHELIKNGGLPSTSGLQVLLAARDTDWTRRIRELGFNLDPAEAWKSMGPMVSTKHPFGRVTETDARKIVLSWRALESHSPDAIRDMSDGDAARRLSAASAGAPAQHGALLGGLLAIRYTPEELRAHLVSLLESLSQDKTSSDMTLADVIIILALVDVAGVDGIPSEIIAEFCGTDEFRFRSQIASRLGKEAVANYNDDTVRSRHPMVSHAVYEIAMSSSSNFPVEFAAFRLLELIAGENGTGRLKEGYGQIFELGRRLHKAKLPSNLAPISRSLGIALARKACELRPSTLANYMALSECLRLEKQAKRALVTVWVPINQRLLDKTAWQDWNKNSRTALNEFAITASMAGDELGAAVLRMAALSDAYRAANGKLEYRTVAFTLRGLAIHLSRLYLELPQPWLAKALVDVHGCVLACFTDYEEAVTMATQCLDDARLSAKPFTTPAAFTLRLRETLGQISLLNNDYLDIPLWSSRSAFTDVESVLTQILKGRNA